MEPWFLSIIKTAIKLCGIRKLESIITVVECFISLKVTKMGLPHDSCLVQLIIRSYHQIVKKKCENKRIPVSL